MKIERFKSILLVLLVISSIVLTINKWFDEKLWPEGYNFFSDVKKFFLFDDEKNKEDKFDTIEEILKPSKIIFNNSQNDFDAVIIGRCPTSFAEGKHHSKNAPLSVDKSAFFVA